MAAEWYYADNGQQRGPISFEELRQRAAAGQLRAHDLVWGPGLADWVPASTQAGLFGAGPAPSTGAPPRPEDDDWRQFERPRPPSGLGAGLKILLFGCGGVLALGLLCCGVFALIGFNTQSGPLKEHAWGFGTNDTKHWKFNFIANETVVLTVTSDKDSDMDLFVFTDKAHMDKFHKSRNLENVVGLCVAFDNDFDKDCRVEFVPPATRDFWVLLVNRESNQPARNVHNTGKLVVETPTREAIKTPPVPPVPAPPPWSVANFQSLADFRIPTSSDEEFMVATGAQ